MLLNHKCLKYQILFYNWNSLVFIIYSVLINNNTPNETKQLKL